MKKIIQTELEEGSFFTSDYLKSSLKYDDRSLPPIAKTSQGVRFIVLASFHDAKIMDISADYIFGKDSITVSVDFRNTSTEFKAGRHIFCISFLNVKNMTFPEKMKNLDILDMDCIQEASGLQVNFELVYFIGGQSCHDIWKIDFSDVRVKPVYKLKS